MQGVGCGEGVRMRDPLLPVWRACIDASASCWAAAGERFLLTACPDIGICTCIKLSAFRSNVECQIAFRER